MRYGARDPLTTPAVRRAVKDAEERLRGVGRLLIRKSGTEPLIRIMAEAEDEHLVGEVVDGLAADIRAAV